MVDNAITEEHYIQGDGQRFEEQTIYNLVNGGSQRMFDALD